MLDAFHVVLGSSVQNRHQGGKARENGRNTVGVDEREEGSKYGRVLCDSNWLAMN